MLPKLSPTRHAAGAADTGHVRSRMATAAYLWVSGGCSVTYWKSPFRKPTEPHACESVHSMQLAQIQYKRLDCGQLALWNHSDSFLHSFIETARQQLILS
jgi:hypothetical protein